MESLSPAVLTENCNILSSMDPKTRGPVLLLAEKRALSLKRITQLDPDTIKSIVLYERVLKFKPTKQKIHTLKKPLNLKATILIACLHDNFELSKKEAIKVVRILGDTLLTKPSLKMSLKPHAV